MKMTRTQYIKTLKIAIAAIFGVAIVSYAVWRSLAYARGPEIEIFQPENGSTAASSTVDIIGRADRVNVLYINGTGVSFDSRGDFSQTIVVFPGVNMITLAASDQFGRTTEKELEIAR